MRRRPRLLLSKQALIGNYQRLCQLSGQAACAASVKANGYGLGIAFVGPTLWEAGCRTFFVAYLQEAVALRALLPEAEIYVFHGIDADDVEDCRRLSVRPVLNTLEELRFVRGTGLLPAIHVDTGMQRLGLPMDAVEAIDEFVAQEPIALLMSHLASADQPAAESNTTQLAHFTALQSHFQARIPAYSLANTAGILLGEGYHFDLTRPGIGLYGGSPDPQAPAGFTPVARWLGSVLQVRQLPAGVPVGYGGTYQTSQEQTIVTLSTGYADGYLRNLGNRACVAINGRLAPVVGRVSMDLLTVDVTELVHDGLQIQRGDWLELMGSAVTVDRLAGDSDTIGYEILTRLGSRLERQVVG